MWVGRDRDESHMSQCTPLYHYFNIILSLCLYCVLTPDPQVIAVLYPVQVQDNREQSRRWEGILLG